MLSLISKLTIITTSMYFLLTTGYPIQNSETRLGEFFQCNSDKQCCKGKCVFYYKNSGQDPVYVCRTCSKAYESCTYNKNDYCCEGTKCVKPLCMPCVEELNSCDYSFNNICCNTDNRCVTNSFNYDSSCRSCSVTTEDCSFNSDCCYNTDYCHLGFCVKERPDVNGDILCASNLQISMTKGNISLNCCNFLKSNDNVCFCATSGECNINETCCEDFACVDNECKINK
eukprot:447699_1